jgi:hypothetical protein
MSMMSSRRSARHMLAIAVAAAFVSGCSSEGSTDWGAMFNLIRQSWESRDGTVQLDTAAAIPYATLGIRIGGETERILILGSDTSGERLWTSAARIALTTRQGRIVATAGLGHDLSAYNSDSAFLGSWKSGRHFSWMADFPDLGLYSVEIDCADAPAGVERITILGQEIDSIRVDESCRSDRLDWSFTNTYWVSEVTNRVWRSVQHIHPRLDALEIELLRPPESPD